MTNARRVIRLPVKSLERKGSLSFPHWVPFILIMSVAPTFLNPSFSGPASLILIGF